MNIQSLSDINNTRWFRQSIETLQNDSSLSEEDINRFITDTIAEYIIGTIGILDLLEFSDALKNCKAKPTQELKHIAGDLSVLHQHKHDKQFIHNILIDILRKVTRT